MIKEIIMPAGGQTTSRSVISAWRVKKGDSVRRGDVLLDIETDKAVLPVECFTSGVVLDILAEPGDLREAGDVIAYVGSQSDSLSEYLRAKGAPEAAPQALPADDARQVGAEEAEEAEEAEYQPVDLKRPRLAEVAFDPPPSFKAMPGARKLAKEKGVSLAEAARFLAKERLSARDVERFIVSGKQAPQANTASGDTLVPLSAMRRTIARRMEQSRAIPAFSASVEVDMTQCIALRKALSDEERKVSYNDILFKCVARAAARYPYINSSYTDEGIVLHADINIGLAVSIDSGLVVPVVRDVAGKSLFEIGETNRANVKKAREGKLTSEDMQGGTITLSNLGAYPITEFTALINPPEACILAVGAAAPRPVARGGRVEIAPIMKITASFDHRVIDGALGAQFLDALKRTIENCALAFI